MYFAWVRFKGLYYRSTVSYYLAPLQECFHGLILFMLCRVILKWFCFHVSDKLSARWSHGDLVAGSQHGPCVWTEKRNCLSLQANYGFYEVFVFLCNYLKYYPKHIQHERTLRSLNKIYPARLEKVYVTKLEHIKNILQRLYSDTVLIKHQVFTSQIVQSHYLFVTIRGIELSFTILLYHVRTWRRWSVLLTHLLASQTNSLWTTDGTCCISCDQKVAIWAPVGQWHGSNTTTSNRAPMRMKRVCNMWRSLLWSSFSLTS